METPSLDYFDRIFDRRGAEFWELVAALEDELTSYAADLGPLVAARDGAGLARLRHSHRPLVENLRLAGTRSLEQELRQALDEGAPGTRLEDLVGQLEGLLLAQAQTLREDRGRAGF
jgi:hypothetical protein